MSLPRYTRWFIDLSKEDINIAGGKAKLGELTQAKIPVPWICSLVLCLFCFLDINGLRPKIHAIYRAVTFLTKAIAYCPQSSKIDFGKKCHTT